MDGLPIRGMLWLIGLIILNALTEAMITALQNVNEPGAEKKAEEGDKRAKLVVWLLAHHRRYITVTDYICVAAVAGMAVVYVNEFLPVIREFVCARITTQNIFVAVLLVVATLLALMLVELFAIKLPKKIAFKHADGIAFGTAKLMKLCMSVLAPLAVPVESVTIGILTLFHIKASELEETVTEEELISTVSEAQESGVLEAEEAEMIHNIFEFDAKEVNDIMTHRKHIVAVDADMTLEDAMQFMMKTAYSRFPVYEESVENIIGILHMKDVARLYLTGNSARVKNRKVRTIARKPYFVPDTQSLDVLFHDMQKKKIHMAFAIDEYGQTAGLVTMEDIVEEIMGDIQDEYDHEEEDILLQEEGVYLVKGTTNLEDLSEVLEQDMTDEDFETLNGLMVSELGHIPMEGEQFVFRYHGCELEIVEVKNKMVTLAKVTKLPEEEEEGSESEEE